MEIKKTSHSGVGLEEAFKLAGTNLCNAYGRTGIGGRSENQDSYGGAFIKSNVILTVCDGMGGMNGGQTASRIAAAEIINTIIEQPSQNWNAELIVKAVKNANAAIYRKSCVEPTLRGMGTTTTVLMLTQEAAFLTHVGDSRIYQMRGKKKYFRTFDHSRVFEMVSQKMITEEQARTSSFSNVITRALGIRQNVDVEVQKLPYKKGDRFVLCCDGIWNCLPEVEILPMFCEKTDPQDEVIYLTEKINGIGVDNGGTHDNLTAIIADMKQDSAFQYSIFRPLKIALCDLVVKMKIPQAKTSNNNK